MIFVNQMLLTITWTIEGTSSCPAVIIWESRRIIRFKTPFNFNTLKP